MFARFPRAAVLVLLSYTLIPRTFAGCIDSIHLRVQPVQCFGLRNGVIEVTEVFGGQMPFFFSLDGLSYSTRPVMDLLWAGDYTLFVKDANSCVDTYAVKVPQPEELLVKLTVPDTHVVAGVPLELKAIVFPPDRALAAIEWRPPDIFPDQQRLSQTIQIGEDTEFYVEVRDSNGCIGRDHVAVTVEKSNVYAPNAFAPGSNQNDYFTLFAGEGVARILSLQVYSRAGHLVFEKRDFAPNDPLKGWNGKWRGRPAPPGVYPWVAQVEYLNGAKKQFSGGVTLVN